MWNARRIASGAVQLDEGGGGLFGRRLAGARFTNPPSNCWKIELLDVDGLLPVVSRNRPSDTISAEVVQRQNHVLSSAH